MPPPTANDSSESDTESYTETSVLLGYASQEITGDSASHLGGTPQWLDDKPSPGQLAHCALCNDLTVLLLQLNGDLPERFPGHERRLYVVSCRRKACRRKEGAIRGFRGTKISKAAAAQKKSNSGGQHVSSFKPVEESKSVSNMGETLFGVHAPSHTPKNANPFSTPGTASSAHNSSLNSTSSASNPFSRPQAQQPNKPTSPSLVETFSSKARISTTSAPSQPAPPAQKPTPWPPSASFPAPYPLYYLDADYETLDKPSAAPIPPQAKLDADFDIAMDDDKAGGGGGKEDKEAFESSLDKTFQRFASRLAQNPEQVLRYEFGGAPLLYSRDDAVGKRLGQYASNKDDTDTRVGSSKVRTVKADGGNGLPRCTICGSERVFELQLTPEMISALETDEEGVSVGQGGKLEAVGMQWGTVILGVCAQDCVPQGTGDGDVGYVEEWVGVQYEELMDRA